MVTPRQCGCWMRICLVLLLGFHAIELRAVILASGNSTTNTTDPGTGLPFGYVGTVNNVASGIFLGNYNGKSWVLTANHVGLGPFVLGGTSYSAIAGSGHQLLNADNSLSDVFLYQISGNPGLAPLSFASSTPTNGSQVYMVGFGRDRLANRTYWIDNGGAWTQTFAGDPLANRIGYQWSGPQPGVERWGTGLVAGQTMGLNNTAALYTNFLDQTNNAALTTGDSGGGVFVHQAGQWQLAGMLDATGVLPNQPAGTSILNTAGVGSTNVFADLTQYDPQINALLSPVPELSFNGYILIGSGLLLGIGMFRKVARVTLRV
jgi:hypothetical protein